MLDTPFFLDLTADITNNTLENLVFEAETVSDLDFFNRVSLPESILEALEAEGQKEEKSNFVISSYTPISGAKKIHILYIHDKSRYTEELAKMLRKIEGDIAFYVPKKDSILPVLDTLVLGSYRFDQFLAKKSTKRLALISPEITEDFRPVLEDRVSLHSAIYLARDLVNTPANLKYPKKLAEQIQKLPWRNTKVSVMDRKELETKGFNLLLAVSAGSDRDPAVVVFERTIDKSLPTYALAGKGVTFDAGGLQIKPDDAMLTMKDDMSGAAAVVASLLCLDAHNDLAGNVVAAVGLTENLLGGSAMKPLDIYRAYNGKTVEIGHTDAEGRLVLADIFSYLESVYHPTSLISVATLTGACMHALGYNYAGLIGNDQGLADRILSARAGEERFWQLPLDAHMIDAAKGDITDVKNVTDGYKAGASMGAAFLAHFLEKTPFVHLDIAAPAYRPSEHGYFPKGGTGFGVMTIVEVLKK